MAQDGKFKISVALTYDEWIALIRPFAHMKKPDDWRDSEWLLTMGESRMAREVVINKISSDGCVKNLLAKRNERVQSP